MQFNLHLDTAALEAYTAGLDRIAERALDATPVMRRIADDVHVAEAEMFASEGARVGGWTPDTDTWIASKARTDKPVRTLAYTQTLERSLTTRTSKYSLDVAGPGELTVGTLDPVAHLQALGTGERFVKTWRGQPMRKPRFAGKVQRHPLLPVMPADEKRWSAYIVEWLTSDAAGITVGL